MAVFYIFHNFFMVADLLRRVSFCVVRKNQRSKEFSRYDDSIPYLDNAKLILFLTTQNETRLSDLEKFDL